MRLDQALVARGLCESRTEAQELIQEGKVIVNGAITTKQTRQTTDVDELVVTGRRQFVSRGGEKLSGVLHDVFGSDEEIHHALQSKAVLDVGSSTGGFTDCLLSYGVTSVDAVDVGTEQLHPKLIVDTRVSLFENTDIRSFTSSKLYDIIVADLSFISLEDVFLDIIKYGKQGTRFFLLIKPQFEVGKGNTKKGIVKDTELVSHLLAKYERAMREHMQDVAVYPSTLKGGDGNQEYFIVGKM